MGSEGERVNGNKTELRLPTITYTKLFINGQFVDAVSVKRLKRLDPRTEQIIPELQKAIRMTSIWPSKLLAPLRFRSLASSSGSERGKSDDEVRGVGGAARGRK
ncbi:unnamed protein product [Rhodiola kirilowii]